MPGWARVLVTIFGLAALGWAVQAAVIGDVRVVVRNGILAGFFLWPALAPLIRRPAVRNVREPAPNPNPENLRDRGRRCWILPAVLLLVVGVLSLFDRPAPGVVSGYALVGSGIVFWRIRRGGDEVDFDDDALVVRRPNGTEKRYAWSDVLELSWAATDWPGIGAGPVARVRGGSFDIPGPTSPAQIASVVLGGDENRRWGREQVRLAAARHQIPWTDGLLDLVTSGKRRPRLPGESS